MSLCKTAAWLAAAGIALLAPGCQPGAVPTSNGVDTESPEITSGTVSAPESEPGSLLEPVGYDITHPNAPTRIYAYRDRGGELTIEEIADILIDQYIGDMMIKQDNKSFEILETHNLRYTLEKAPADTAQWSCRVEYQFRFAGAVYHEEGDGWIFCRTTFTLQRDGELYRMTNGETFPDVSEMPSRRKEDINGYAVTTPIQPNRVYSYRDRSDKLTNEEIADILTKQYIGDMMIRQDDKSFEITEIYGLNIEIEDAKTYNEKRTDKESGAWNSAGSPLEDNQWHCFIGYQYLYEGRVDAEGNNGVPTGDWCPGGWHLGYIIERDGDLYTMTRNEG